MTQTTTTTAATFDPLEDLFATSQGLLRVWPINRPVVELWRLLPDQWIRGGMEAIPIAPDMTQALAYAQAWCQEHPGITQPLSLVMRLRFLADTMLRFIHADREVR
jgi:hypothetical protein